MNGILRRDFLASLGAAAIGSPAPRACILVWLDGGPSHVDTFDPKEAVSPFRAIPTNVPGVRISEHLPRTARLAHKLTILRSLTATETNHERAAREIASVGQAVSPVQYIRQPSAMLEEFSRARREIERGAKFAIAGCGRLHWDTHEHNFDRLKNELLPEFDAAFSALIEDMDASGLLATTLVVATGEFGRTPRLNARGGRDHHAGAWSAVIAGGGVPGGRVIGATDRYGYEVTDDPVSPAALAEAIASVRRGRFPEALA